mgnify:CR=1 FL=1
MLEEIGDELELGKNTDVCESTGLLATTQPSACGVGCKGPLQISLLTPPFALVGRKNKPFQRVHRIWDDSGGVTY